MKATDLLEAQHRKVEALFKRIEGGRSSKKTLARELTDQLAAHMRIEEELFYPAVKRVKEDLVLESFEEHDVARYAMRNLLATRETDERFDARVTTLRELIEHHVKEEEEELFPKVEKAMSKEQLEALGLEMKREFDRLSGKGLAKLYGSATTTAKRPAARTKSVGRAQSTATA